MRFFELPRHLLVEILHAFVNTWVCRYGSAIHRVCVKCARSSSFHQPLPRANKLIYLLRIIPDHLHCVVWKHIGRHVQYGTSTTLLETTTNIFHFPYCSRWHQVSFTTGWCIYFLDELVRLNRCEWVRHLKTYVWPDTIPLELINTIVLLDNPNVYANFSPRELIQFMHVTPYITNCKTLLFLIPFQYDVYQFLRQMKANEKLIHDYHQHILDIPSVK